MINKLAKFIDRFRGGNQLTQWGCGRWYVIYDDGQKSTTMHFETACGYARIFGGKVHHVSDINPA